MSDMPSTASKSDRLYTVALAVVLAGSLAVTVFAAILREDKRVIIGDANGVAQAYLWLLHWDGR